MPTRKPSNTASAAPSPDAGFNRLALAACQRIGAKLLSSPPAKPNPGTPLAQRILQAASTSDHELAERLLAESGMSLPDIFATDAREVFSSWWDTKDLHHLFDLGRLASMVRWFDRHGVPLTPVHVSFSALAAALRAELESPDAPAIFPPFPSEKSCKKSPGAALRAQRLLSLREWPLMAQPHHYGAEAVKERLNGARALVRLVADWAADPDPQARVTPGEAMDAAASSAGSTHQSVMVLSAFSDELGVPVGARRWEAASLNALRTVCGLRNHRVDVASLCSTFQRALAADRHPEPLGERSATALAALAISQGNVNLLAQVLHAAPKVDWTLRVLGELAPALAQAAVGHRHSAHGAAHCWTGKVVSAIAYAKLVGGWRCAYGQGSAADVQALVAALASIPEAAQAAQDHPLPEMHIYSSSSNAIETCRILPALALPDAEGRNMAHVWARAASDPDDIDRIRRLLDSRLAPLAMAADAHGDTPLTLLSKLSQSARHRDAFDRLAKAVSERERKDLSKDLGRKTKGLVKRSPARI